MSQGFDGVHELFHIRFAVGKKISFNGVAVHKRISHGVRQSELFLLNVGYS